jgi:hypothetical protein
LPSESESNITETMKKKEKKAKYGKTLRIIDDI